MARVRAPKAPDHPLVFSITRSEDFGSVRIDVDKPLALDVSAGFLAGLHSRVTDMMIGKAHEHPGLAKAWKVSPPDASAGGSMAHGEAVDKSTDAPKYFSKAFRAVTKKAVRLALAEWSPTRK